MLDMVPILGDEWLKRLSMNPESRPGEERRRTCRLPLHWPLYLACPGQDFPRGTETVNLSREGFYCVLDEPLTAGDHFACEIVLPTHLPDSDSFMSLRCRARVIRVEK